MLGLSARQLGLVDELHGHTLREEGRLTAKMATVQEDVADRPLLSAARVHRKITSSSAAAAAAYAASSSSWGNDGDVAAAIKSCAEEMAGLLVEADRLRVATARALLTEILGPKQAVELLVAAKQLHLSIHNFDYGATVDPGPGPYAGFFSYHYVASETQLRDDPSVALFFLEKDLRPGKKMTLHFPEVASGPAFLPRKEADAIPLSVEKLPEVLGRFGIQPDSVEARWMRKTARECQEPAVGGEKSSAPRRSSPWSTSARRASGRATCGRCPPPSLRRFFSKKS
ncbi:BURP domain-containing protein 3 [Ananas comosus]|uniref:BURP domain-containing protein 3 n=1 Tax=Ananas comosus TaxID=4615 RepID=A0A199W280_ANACO|nr:BURP domain-containing protein 3 [Ananas comosus]